MKNSLLITLGHNSSAIFVSADQKVIIGYEQERLDGIKSSSRFPNSAIIEIAKNVGLERLKDCRIFISHWFDSSVEPFGNKYITDMDYENLKAISTDIQFVNKNFTHHDAHAFSAFAFMQHNITDEHRKLSASSVMTNIVADGFGNDQEVLSIYSSCTLNNTYTKPELLKRVYGYRYSLGLMYQYATSFCGMKENQDEYKFLGYEPMIESMISNEYMPGLNYVIEENVTFLLSAFDHKTVSMPVDKSLNTLINIKVLEDVKKMWHSKFADVIGLANLTESDTVLSRVVVAYFIQQSIEKYFERLVNMYEITDVTVSGGIFYNVKLNNSILTNIEGLFCVLPLAGDQGAAIGMLVNENFKETGSLYFNFKSLSIGKRNLSEINKFANKYIKVIDFTADTADSVVDYITRLIVSGKIVNLINGNMEFGPRALCNTSSLFLPTADLVAQNNKNNNRNEVMPCAPVIKKENGSVFFDKPELDRTIGSDKFMICTHSYALPKMNSPLIGDAVVKAFLDMYAGVAHQKTLHDNVFTGRPQFVEESTLIWHILDNIEKIHNGPKALVNTSFNAHGRPIAFDVMDIIHNFNYQFNNAGDNKPYLIILNYKECE